MVRNLRHVVLGCFALLLVIAPTGLGQPAPAVDVYLVAGSLSTAQRALNSYLVSEPTDDTALFSLGTVQFLQAVEHLAQAWYRYGLSVETGSGMALPLLRLPLPENPKPEAISYEAFRAVIQRFADDLTRSEATLARVEDGEVSVPIRFGRIHLDLNGDGRVGEDETLWKLYTRFNRQTAMQERRGELSEEAKDFYIFFDEADVYWLRGYSHLLLAISEFYLAHDGRDLFERTAQLFYPEVESPHDILGYDNQQSIQGFDLTVIADVVSFVHLVRLESTEPARMQAALGHLEAVIELSRLSWQSILSETDNEREWIPGPSQTSVIPVAVTPDIVAGWQTFLDEAEAVLKGDKLIPHWRVTDGRGINLRRAFTEPSSFDLVLWLQGSAATPYLETGELSSGETWQQLQRMFGGNFLGFALWFN